MKKKAVDPELYTEINEQLAALLEGERNMIANAANTCALIFQLLPNVNWVGFYFLDGDQLVLGPFQGKPACVRITLGEGVCGKAAKERKSCVVENVHEFPGHIACDPASNSEIVVPIVQQDRLIGVLDVDSAVPVRFDETDRKGIEILVKTFLSCTDMP